MSSRNRRLLGTGALAILVVGIAAIAMNSIYASASSKPTVRTVTVQRGTVASTVTATGNVSPSAAYSVNFGSGGIVTEIDVKAGDHVTAGQPLAKLDDTQTKAALVSAQAALNSAQANLVAATQPITPTIAAQNQAALITAQQQVVSAQSTLNAAILNAQLNAVGYQNSLSQAQAQLTRDTNQLNSDLACTTCASMVNADQNAVNKDRDALTNTRQQQVVGQVKDQQAIQQAQNGLLTAQAGLASTQASNNAKATSTPASLAQAQSGVSQAQAALLTAQKNEAGMTLTAPTDGTVAALNGVVGQTVSGGGTASASSSSSSAASSSASSSASSAFVTLDNVAALQVLAGFAESDASKIQVGQTASVTLNAIPGIAIAGTVTKVDVTSTVVSNVVTYNVTIGLTAPPAGAKPGMTANASVVIASHDNVLHVPTADVATRGGVSTVTVQQNGKPIVQVVTVGLVGDQSTEITSGLNEGDTIVEPTVSISTGTGTGVTTRVGGGLGGGGLGGPGGGIGGGGGGG